MTIRHCILRSVLRYDVIAFFACIAFFLIWPDFDLYVSSYFFDQDTGDFFWKNHFIVKSVYTLTNFIGATLILGLPTMVAASWLIKKEYWVKRRRMFLFLLSACILGPGLVVNVLLKDHWERPRPRQVIEFAGDHRYEPPFSPSFECKSCYSFVSGHGSIGFYFFALALLCKKKSWLFIPAIIGACIGAGRIVQGAHFFADVLFSGWVVWFCSLFLYRLFFTRWELASASITKNP